MAHYRLGLSLHLPKVFELEYDVELVPQHYQLIPLLLRVVIGE